MASQKINHQSLGRELLRQAQDTILKEGGLGRLPDEEWMIVPEMPRYAISNMGRLLSLYGYWLKEKPVGCPYIMKPRLVGKYLAVLLMRPRMKSKGKLIHRIVAETWLGPANRNQVNHKNGIKTDNRLVNLEWVTPSENVLHAYRNRLKTAINGDDHGRSIITQRQAMKIFNSVGLVREIAKMYGVSEALVSRIRKKRLWVFMHKDKTPDPMIKRRPGAAKGSDHGLSKINESVAMAIYLSDGPNTLIARKYGICPANVGAIKKKKTWKHIHQ